MCKKSIHDTNIFSIFFERNQKIACYRLFRMLLYLSRRFTSKQARLQADIGVAIGTINHQVKICEHRRKFQGKKHCLDVKTNVVRDYEAGKRHMKLSKQFNVLVSSVQSIIKKGKKQSSVTSKPRTGAP